MLNFVIFDDNLNIFDRLEKMLDTIFCKNDFEAQVAFSSDNTEEVLNYISSNKVDVAMLDINLKSNKTGIELAKEIRKINKISNFLSSFSNFFICNFFILFNHSFCHKPIMITC